MEFIVEEKGGRLDKFLASHDTKFSRTEWQRFIKDGAVSVNGRVVTKSALTLHTHDKLTILEEKTVGRKGAFRIEPDPGIPLDIVYEDADILVVNKPAGLLVHPTFTERRHTLVNALVARYPEIIAVGENPLRAGIVHRLDKDTSGLVVVAKNQSAFFSTKQQFLDRVIVKKYLALTEGIPNKPEGDITYDIRPSTGNRLRKVAVKKLEPEKRSRRSAETHYAVKETFGTRFALIDVTPKTGRTHQIRVHLAAILCPIVGDTLYGGKRKTGLALGLKRHFLHAYYLKLTLPSGKEMTFEIGLPEDLRRAIGKLTGSSVIPAKAGI
ncbi:MAG: RluA family pseudouridine synthase [bacterium]|nr:RluA family pseudouridine synthase [bacterium]